ncbi:MAG TPA: NUDIX domain-containing protein [Candidatus Bathyarchaeia archaeon]|nr:NUDIX domain-containing protein [Candidatus Bathyarchaeia archaeon]
MPGQFFLAVAAFIAKKGKLLVLKRSPYRDHEPGCWETVSGRLEQNIKNVKSELLREIREELGSDFQCQVIAPFGTYNFYRCRDKSQEHIGIDYICRYTSGIITLSQEHSEYRWIDPREFTDFKANDSLINKVRLFTKVRSWYLRNGQTFRGYK